MLVIRDDASLFFILFFFLNQVSFKVWPLWVSAICPELPEFLLFFFCYYFLVVVQDGPERTPVSDSACVKGCETQAFLSFLNCHKYILSFSPPRPGRQRRRGWVGGRS